MMLSTLSARSDTPGRPARPGLFSTSECGGELGFQTWPRVASLVMCAGHDECPRDASSRWVRLSMGEVVVSGADGPSEVVRHGEGLRFPDP